MTATRRPSIGIESPSVDRPSPSPSQWWSRGVRAYMFDVFLAGANFLLSLPGHRLRGFVLTRMVRFDMGVDVAVERRVRVEARGGVTIGDRCNINRGVTLDGRGGLTIGSDVNISPEVTVLTGYHDPNSPTFDAVPGPVVISDRAWLATRAFVLPGASIGEGAIVAAAAVVHGDVPAWTIVGGNPAKVIGQRSPDAQVRMAAPYRRFLH